MIEMEVLGNMIKFAESSSAWQNLSDNIGEAYDDVGTGLSKDWKDMKLNFDSNWERNKKESQYGNFANMLPVLGSAALLAPLGLYGAHKLMGRLSPFRLAASLFSRGKVKPVA